VGQQLGVAVQLHILSAKACTQLATHMRPRSVLLQCAHIAEQQDLIRFASILMCFQEFFDLLVVLKD